jgi:pre-mRNA-processing factor 8
MFGLAPAHAPQVREVKCLVFVPQRGSNVDVEFAAKPPEHASLKGLEFLGTLRTQSSETSRLGPADVERQAKKYPMGVTLSCAFTPGSILLTAFKISPAALLWGKESPPVDGRAETAPGFHVAEFSKKCTMLLSERIVGFFLVPGGGDEGFWNYAFAGHRFLRDMDYQLKVDVPLAFYDETHRSEHFRSFSEGVASTVPTGSSSNNTTTTTSSSSTTNNKRNGKLEGEEEVADIENHFR